MSNGAMDSHIASPMYGPFDPRATLDLVRTVLGQNNSEPPNARPMRAGMSPDEIGELNKRVAAIKAGNDPSLSKFENEPQGHTLNIGSLCLYTCSQYQSRVRCRIRKCEVFVNTYFHWHKTTRARKPSYITFDMQLRRNPSSASHTTSKSPPQAPFHHYLSSPCSQADLS